MALTLGNLLRAGFALGALAILTAMVLGPQQRDATGLAEAIDGDSLRLNGQEMRLKGIDAPELHQTCDRPAKGVSVSWECGRESRAWLRRLLARGLVTCVGSEKDRYGRLLVSCRVLGVDINAEMVREGFAVSFGAYADEEKFARDDARGIWAGTFQAPREWRKTHPR